MRNDEHGCSNDVQLMYRFFNWRN